LKLRPKPGRNIIGLSDVHNVEIQFLCRLRLRIELQFLFQNSKIFFDSVDKTRAVLRTLHERANATPASSDGQHKVNTKFRLDFD
jgi:hypothetical protein